MHEKIRSMKQHRVDRTDTYARTCKNSGECNQPPPGRIGDGNVELLKGALPKNGKTLPREWRVERIAMDVGVIIPKRKEMEGNDLSVNGCHDEQNENSQKQ